MTGYNILVIGSGAREHAIVRALDKSSQGKNLYCLASNMNPGIAELCVELRVGKINDPDFVVHYAQEISTDLAIIGPEKPLENGIADALWSVDIKTIGPKKNLALLETSKAFTRNLLREHGVPGGPLYQTFVSMEGVNVFLKELKENYVVKYDGLMGGKGVKVAGDHLRSHDEALAYCQELLDRGGSFVVEEKFVGQEFSLMSFCDGESLKHMPVIQDHKRVYEGDRGPNTGGMGTYSFANHSLPFLSEKDVSDAQKTNERVAKELYRTTGTKFKGFLYGGFMATKDGIKVIEYNARLGDPEAMNVLSLLKTDFFDICNHIIGGSLKSVDVKFEPHATVCKYAVPNGYPDNPEKGFAVSIENVDTDSLFFAAVREDKNKIIATGSRTVACVGVDKEVCGAEQKAEAGISRVVGNVFHRKDIGTAALIQKRIENMKKVRQ